MLAKIQYETKLGVKAHSWVQAFNNYIVAASATDVVIYKSVYYMSDNHVKCCVSPQALLIFEDYLSVLSSGALYFYELSQYFSNDVTLEIIADFQLTVNAELVNPQLFYYDSFLYVISGCQLLKVQLEPLKLVNVVKFQYAIMNNQGGLLLSQDGGVFDLSGQLIFASNVLKPVMFKQQLIFQVDRINQIFDNSMVQYKYFDLLGYNCVLLNAQVVNGKILILSVSNEEQQTFTYYCPLNALSISNMKILNNYELVSCCGSNYLFSTKANAEQCILQNIVFTADKALNPYFSWDLIFQLDRLVINYDNSRSELSKQETLQLPSKCLTNNRHPAIQLKREQLRALKKQQSLQNQPIFFHKPRATICKDLPWGEKQKMSKSKSSGVSNSQAQVESRDSISGSILFTFQNSAVMTALRKSQSLIASTNTHKLQFYEINKNQFILKQQISVNEQIEQFSVNQSEEIAAIKQKNRILVYFKNSTGYQQSAEIQLKNQCQFAQVLWPEHTSQGLLAYVSNKQLIFSHIEQKFTLELKKFNFPLQIKTAGSLSNCFSSQIIMSFAGFDQEKTQNPYFLAFDYIKETPSFLIKNENSPFSTSVNEIFLKDYSSQNCNLFGISTNNKLALYDLRIQNPVCVSLGRNCQFCGDNYVFVGSEKKLFDIRNQQYLQLQGIQGNQSVISSTGTAKGCFYSLQNGEMGYFAI